jgi:uncharacterized protein
VTALPSFGLFNTEARVFHSNCLNQDFQIGVWFPFSYFTSDQNFPVLFVPDGEYAFPAVVGLIPTLIGAGEAPEMLVVGISYHGISGWQEFGTLRDRNFCTQPFQAPESESRHVQYTRFFQDELFPLVESHYRVDVRERALFGFSSAGFFALHMMLTQPGMFRRHIAASCTWPGAGEYFLECAQRYAEGPAAPPTDLYLAVGRRDEEQVPCFHQLVAYLSSDQFHNLRLVSKEEDGEGHTAGMIGKTILEGLRTVFKE